MLDWLESRQCRRTLLVATVAIVLADALTRPWNVANAWWLISALLSGVLLGLDILAALFWVIE